MIRVEIEVSAPLPAGTVENVTAKFAAILGEMSHDSGLVVHRINAEQADA